MPRRVQWRAKGMMATRSGRTGRGATNTAQAADTGEQSPRLRRSTPAVPDDHLLVRVDAVNLKDVLGEIKTNRANLHVDGPLIVIRLRRSRYGTSMPGAGAVHYIRFGSKLRLHLGPKSGRFPSA
jgi:hypothetical protein